MRPARSGLLIASLALAAVLPAPTRAACDGPAPSFRAGIDSAEMIVIGEVIAAGPHDPARDRASFALRVDHVLRGSAPEVMDVRDVMLHPCAGVMTASVGDVIAIAFAAGDANPVAYIRGNPSRADIERLTVSEVFSLAGVAMPADAEEPMQVPWPMVVGIGVLAIAGVAAFRSRPIPARRQGR